MRYYPIFVDLSGQACLVVGGGSVAERKVTSLLNADGQVTVISPTLTTQLRSWATERRITTFERAYQPGDMSGFTLVFAATSDEILHQNLAAEAKQAGILLNVVDRPRLCSFIVPAVVSQGDLSLAISTGGASPALAKKIRRELAADFGPEYGLALQLLARIRERLSHDGGLQSRTPALLYRFGRLPPARLSPRAEKLISSTYSCKTYWEKPTP